MFALLKTLLLTAALQQSAGNAKRRLRQATLQAVIAIFGGLLVLGGAIFLIIAGHDALVVATDARTANLICGAMLVVFGAAVIAIGLSTHGYRMAEAAPSAPILGVPTLDSAVALGRDIEAMISRNAGTVATGAFVAGLILAARRR